MAVSRLHKSINLVVLSPAIWAGVIRLLDWGGRIDFVANHVADVSRGGAVIALFVNPPAWLIFSSIIAGLALIWMDTRRYRQPARQLGRRRTALDPFLIVAILSGIVCLGSLLGYVLNKAEGPIKWDISNNYSPLGASMRMGEALWIEGFQLKGMNRTDNPIEPIEAYIRSDTNMRIISLGGLSRGLIIPLEKSILTPDFEFS